MQIMYFDGIMVPTSYAKLAKDLLTWRGRGVFEALRVRRVESNGTKKYILFHFNDHYERLLKSCKLARIPTDTLLCRDSMLEKIENILEQNNHYESVVKIAVTRGDSENDLKPSGPPKLLIKTFPLAEPRDFLKLELQTGVRRQPEAKSIGEYDYALQRREEANERGFDDFVYWDSKAGITEASLANIFFVTRRNELVTSVSNVLFGVTRKITLALAKDSWLFDSVTELPVIHLVDIEQCREAFLTSTTLGVAEINTITDTSTGKKYQFMMGRIRRAEILKKMFSSYVEDYFKAGA